jgi:adenine-specific DNA-methyltransferase
MVTFFHSISKDGVVPQTLWFYKDVGHTQEAKKELLATLDFSSSDDVFETPNPGRLIQKMLRIATTQNDYEIVLDFFSGSGTTAHAVMQLNDEDGGNRRFIVVQLPELTGNKDYPSIAEIGKERIRRAGQQIQDELVKQGPKLDFEDQAAKPLDTGFKVFKLDTSNLKQWDSSPIPDRSLLEFERRLNEMMDSVKPDRTELNMIYEVMLKMGRPLTETVTPREFDGKKAYSIREDNLLIICLAKDINQEAVKQMAALAPARLIFGQECFADMTALSNAKLYLRNLEMPFQFIL